jgi:hypothetical protein
MSTLLVHDTEVEYGDLALLVVPFSEDLYPSMRGLR